VNKHATIRKDANIHSRSWLFVFITNNPILVDPFTAESVITAMTDGNGFKVRSLTGRFCDISEIFFGRITITYKFKCKNSEGNKGNEHVFNPIVDVKSKLSHDAQYPIINTREVHILLHFLKKRDVSRLTT
jgi:hypothetical protein